MGGAGGGIHSLCTVHGAWGTARTGLSAAWRGHTTPGDTSGGTTPRSCWGHPPLSSTRMGWGPLCCRLGPQRGRCQLSPHQVANPGETQQPFLAGARGGAGTTGPGAGSSQGGQEVLGGAPRCCRRVRGAAVGEEAHGRQRPHGRHRGTMAQLGLGRRHRGTRAWPRGSPCTGEVVHECASACVCACTGVCTRRRVPRAGCVFSAGPCRWVCRERLAPVRSPGGAGGGRGHWQSHHV